VLYQPSIQSNRARRRPAIVAQGRRSINSRLMVAKKLSATALDLAVNYTRFVC